MSPFTAPRALWVSDSGKQGLRLGLSQQLFRIERTRDEALGRPPQGLSGSSRPGRPLTLYEAFALLATVEASLSGR